MVEANASRRHRLLLRLLLGGLVSGVALYLALRNISWQTLYDALASVRQGYVLLAVLSVILSSVIKAWRWQMLFLPAKPAFFKVWETFLIGQMLNTVLPVRIGEVARVLLIDDGGDINRADGISTIFLEKAADLLMLGAAYLLTVVWLTLTAVNLPSWFTEAGPSLLAVAVGLVGGLFLLRYLGKPAYSLMLRVAGWLPRSWERRITGFLTDLRASFRRIKDQRVRRLLWLISLLVWLTGSLTNYLMLRAFDFTVPPLAAVFLLVVLMSGIVVPTLPGNIGVFPYLSMLVLSLFGVSRASGLAFGFLLHLVVYIPLLVLGGLSILHRGIDVSRVLEPGSG